LRIPNYRGLRVLYPTKGKVCGGMNGKGNEIGKVEIRVGIFWFDWGVMALWEKFKEGIGDNSRLYEDIETRICTYAVSGVGFEVLIEKN